MVTARLAIRRRRTFIKDIAGSIITPFCAAFEDTIKTPKIELLLLEFIDDRAVDLRVYWPEHDFPFLHVIDTNCLKAKMTSC